MALYHICDSSLDVKNGFAYVLQFFSLISDGLVGVYLIFAILQFEISSLVNWMKALNDSIL